MGMPTLEGFIERLLVSWTCLQRRRQQIIDWFGEHLIASWDGLRRGDPWSQRQIAARIGEVWALPPAYRLTQEAKPRVPTERDPWTLELAQARYRRLRTPLNPQEQPEADCS